jgi:endonuclease IV
MACLSLLFRGRSLKNIPESMKDLLRRVQINIPFTMLNESYLNRFLTNNEKDDHLPMGSGTIDFRPLFNYMKLNRKSSPIITLEPHCEADMWLSLAYLSKVCPW